MELSTLIEKWAQTALEQNWVDKWQIGAIRPTEMVFFMAQCQKNNVNNIIESGRQDGVSTEIIGNYVQKTGGRAYSIDWEMDREQAMNTRKRLAGNPCLCMLAGDVKYLFGPLVLSAKGKETAVLIDGPKGFYAMGLLFAAAALRQVSVIAIHNLSDTDTKTEKAFFSKRISKPVFYEDVSTDTFSASSAWSELKQKEHSVRLKLVAERASEPSSLAVGNIKKAKRLKLLFSFSWQHFRWNQPAIHLIKWLLLPL